jgi:hypothetical protein
MGFFANLFKPKAQPEEDVDRSVKMMEKLKARRGQETGKWLALMESGSRVPPPSGPEPTIEDVDQREILDEAPYVPPLEAQIASFSDIEGAVPDTEKNQTVAGVEKLFAEFQHQADEYNTSAAATQIFLMVHPPEFTFEEPTYEHSRNPVQKVSVFKGHIVAQHWALFVQGYEDKIDIYVISADEILNFTLNEIRKAGVTPFITIESTMVDGKRLWNVAGTRICLDTLPLLAKELLGDLIRIATGTMSEEELFADYQTDLKLGETVAQGYKCDER